MTRAELIAELDQLESCVEQATLAFSCRHMDRYHNANIDKLEARRAILRAFGFDPEPDPKDGP
jgi:hypothetical protein